MAERLISVPAARAYIEATVGDQLLKGCMNNVLDAVPAVDAVPVVHGRWAWDTEDIYKCSNCGEKSHVKEVMGQPDWGYCPNCGAKMDLEV